LDQALGSKKQPYITLSSTETMDNSEPTKLLCDNQIAIKLLENLVLYDRTKHLAIKHHFIGEKVAKKEIEVVHVASLS
jgi:hypothetical protein